MTQRFLINMMSRSAERRRVVACLFANIVSATENRRRAERNEWLLFKLDHSRQGEKTGAADKVAACQDVRDVSAAAQTAASGALKADDAVEMNNRQDVGGATCGCQQRGRRERRRRAKLALLHPPARAAGTAAWLIGMQPSAGRVHEPGGGGGAVQWGSSVTVKRA